MARRLSIAEKVGRYPQDSRGRYEPGEDEYYARAALQEALEAYGEGNYGIGAVALVVEDDQILEYRARNAMITGRGVVDHAETRALIAIRSGDPAEFRYPRDLNEQTLALPKGLSVYGTLEPCPMCACTLTNVGAIRSISTSLDGKLRTKNGYRRSDGAANVIGNKSQVQPLIWQNIQQGLKLKFVLLKTKDERLAELSLQVFLETREEIDKKLANREGGTKPAKREILG